MCQSRTMDYIVMVICLSGNDNLLVFYENNIFDKCHMVLPLSSESITDISDLLKGKICMDAMA